MAELSLQEPAPARGPRRRFKITWPSRSDVAIAALMGALELIGLILDLGTIPLGPDPAPILIYFAFGYAILPWRHIAPLTVLGLTVAHQALAIPVLTPGAVMATESAHVPFAGVLVAVAAVATDRTMAVSIPAALLAFMPSAVAVGSRVLSGWPAVYLLTLLVEIGAAWAIGTGIARSRRRVRLLQSAQELATAAVREERARIAAELHDIVSHSVTVMTLHAAGGRRIMETDPHRAIGALDVIERVGSETVDELHRLLDVLRSADLAGHAPDEPVHTLDEIESLLAPIRAAGIPVDVTVRGRPAKLDPSVDHTAYRTIQEALTNTTKHAGPGVRATVGLAWSSDRVVVEVRDDGGAGARTSGGGYGLVGLAERVALVGGTLAYGPAGGGFVVRAELPATRRDAAAAAGTEG